MSLYYYTTALFYQLPLVKKIYFSVTPQRTTKFVMWTRSGTETAEWLRAQVTVSFVDTQRVGKISL